MTEPIAIIRGPSTTIAGVETTTTTTTTTTEETTTIAPAIDQSSTEPSNTDTTTSKLDHYRIEYLWNRFRSQVNSANMDYSNIPFDYATILTDGEKVMDTLVSEFNLHFNTSGFTFSYNTPEVEDYEDGIKNVLFSQNGQSILDSWGNENITITNVQSVDSDHPVTITLIYKYLPFTRTITDVPIPAGATVVLDSLAALFASNFSTDGFTISFTDTSISYLGNVTSMRVTQLEAEIGAIANFYFSPGQTYSLAISSDVQSISSDAPAIISIVYNGSTYSRTITSLTQELTSAVYYSAAGKVKLTFRFSVDGFIGKTYQLAFSGLGSDGTSTENYTGIIGTSDCASSVITLAVGTVGSTLSGTIGDFSFENITVTTSTDTSETETTLSQCMLYAVYYASKKVIRVMFENDVSGFIGKTYNLSYGNDGSGTTTDFSPRTIGSSDCDGSILTLTNIDNYYDTIKSLTIGGTSYGSISVINKNGS